MLRMILIASVTSLALITAPALNASAQPAPQSQSPAVASAHSRFVPLQGQSNFRDFGGYRTADGKQQVRWGELYRSGSLARLTDDDYAAVARLRIAAVVDLRALSERAAEPTRWRGGTIDAYAKDYISDTDQALGKVLMSPGVSPQAVQAAMAEFYRQMPEQFADQYAEIFHRLAARNQPLLIHCTAGKDRTGLAAALVLLTLGVQRETVLSDYALTDQAASLMAAASAQPPASGEDPYAFLRRLPATLVTPLMRADPAYLQAAFARIEADYGSVDAYVQKRLGVTNAELALLRARLLEPVA